MPNPKEVLEDLGVRAIGIPVQESLSTKPNHYHSQSFDSAIVQETIFINIASSEEKFNTSAAIKAHWVSFAVEYLLRAGLKDDIDCELKKAENYLHRARTGEWIEE